jgi:hypothetical protein
LLGSALQQRLHLDACKPTAEMSWGGSGTAQETRVIDASTGNGSH